MQTKNIYPNLRAAMARSGKTITQLAADVGMRRDCLSFKLCGHRPFWLSEAAAIADALNWRGDLLELFQKEKA